MKAKCNCRFNWLEVDQKHHDAANKEINKKYPNVVDEKGFVTGNKNMKFEIVVGLKKEFMYDLARKGELTAVCSNCKKRKILQWVDIDGK